tara:strand:- start:1603 stop:2043 length:441 start_codon:yes stop_codon:yes gene_type:complete
LVKGFLLFESGFGKTPLLRRYGFGTLLSFEGSSMNSEKNKRSSPRSSIDTAVFVHIMDEWIECKTIDLSPGAISVEMAFPLVPGSLVAPDLRQSEGMKKHEILTEILRCDTLETNPVTHRSIMKYIEPSEDFLRDAKSLIQSKSPE